MKYSYEKCKKFLEDIGYEFEGDKMLIYSTSSKVVMGHDYRRIVNFLNDEEYFHHLYNTEDVICTLLKNNKDKLIEED